MTREHTPEPQVIPAHAALFAESLGYGDPAEVPSRAAVEEAVEAMKQARIRLEHGVSHLDHEAAKALRRALAMLEARDV